MYFSAHREESIIVSQSKATCTKTVKYLIYYI